MIDPKTIIDARRRMTASHPKFQRPEEDAAEGGRGGVFQRKCFCRRFHSF